ncbi:CRISPR/Cas system CMR-associated protein Cmr1 [Pseudomonas syringae pv. actinidiae]|uniref:CRISPR/Cas system CMR-associated protein Cmr1 n=1 Tax=Pseudomonas syringae pv. actinidiae TaxID=103796 RepID=A0AAN4Q833_PSESF|nr:CRISPR/Cas system CMR-associated protein Cmr1 [Pseudomonas syringae pv. actinidiae]
MTLPGGCCRGSIQHSVQNVRDVILFDLAFSKTTGHLHANTQHGFGDFNVLALHERLGIRREIERNQRTFVIGTTQFYAPVRQFDNFQKRGRHWYSYSAIGRHCNSLPACTSLVFSTR